MIDSKRFWLLSLCLSLVCFHENLAVVMQGQSQSLLFSQSSPASLHVTRSVAFMRRLKLKMDWSKRRRLLLLHHCIRLLAIIGFLVQASQVVQTYLKFETTTLVSIDTSEKIISHTIAFCIRYTDIIDRKGLKKASGVELPVINYLDEALKVESVITIKQIFDHTPAPDHVLIDCSWRPDEWTIIQKSGSAACHDAFTVRRLFTQEFMCYIIRERVNVSLSLTAVTRSTFRKGVMLRVYLNASLSDASFVSPIVHRGWLPTRSRDHSPIVGNVAALREGGKRTSRFDHLNLHYHDVDITRLPKPYDTECVPKPEELMEHCQRDCLIHAFADLNRVPGWHLLEQPYDLPPVSTNDALDPVTGPSVRRSVDKCYSKCHFMACVDGYTETRVNRLRLTDAPALGFTLFAPVSPSQAAVASENAVCRVLHVPVLMHRHLVRRVLPVPDVCSPIHASKSASLQQECPSHPCN